MISAEDFYFKTPLYQEIDYKDEDLESLFKLVYFSGKIDNYCPQCKKDTIFRASPVYLKADKQTSTYSTTLLTDFASFSLEKNIRHFHDSSFEISFTCEREPYSGHTCRFHIKFMNPTYLKPVFLKVGQYPSLADLNDYRTKKFNKILAKEQYEELNKGIGLAGHGIGIGSFVYFRRIFETLIFEAYNQHKDVVDNSLGETKFQHLNMDVKIQTLKPFLPKFIFDNRSLYGVLSMGIHQLKEKECLEKYPLVELGLRLILEDKLSLYEKSQMVEEFKKLRSKS